MDLSFPRFDNSAEVVELPADLAVLMVGIAARQAASPTAAVQVQCTAAIETGPHPLAPGDGAFSPAVAATLTRWKQE